MDKQVHDMAEKLFRSKYEDLKNRKDMLLII